MFLLTMIVVEKKRPTKKSEKMSCFFDHENPKMGFSFVPPKKKDEIQRHVTGLFFFGKHPLPVGNSPLHGGFRIKESTRKCPKNIGLRNSFVV